MTRTQFSKYICVHGYIENTRKCSKFSREKIEINQSNLHHYREFNTYIIIQFICKSQSRNKFIAAMSDYLLFLVTNHKNKVTILTTFKKSVVLQNCDISSSHSVILQSHVFKRSAFHFSYTVVAYVRIDVEANQRKSLDNYDDIELQLNMDCHIYLIDGFCCNVDYFGLA